MYKIGLFYACFEVVKIGLELRLVMFEKKNLMITHRVLQLNFEFKAEKRAGKSERLQIFGVRVRCFKKIWKYHTILPWGQSWKQKDRSTFDGILPTHEYRDSLFAMASFREEQVKSPLLKLS